MEFGPNQLTMLSHLGVALAAGDKLAEQLRARPEVIEFRISPAGN